MNGTEWRAEVRKALAASHKAARNRRGKRPEPTAMLARNVHIVIRPYVDTPVEPEDKRPDNDK